MVESLPMSVIAALALSIFFLAMLYSSVGHAGASGYLAAMALFAIPPSLMRPVALVLNILVATIASLKFYRAGHFSWRLFWPFAITSIPCAYIGGSLTLPTPIYKIVVGAVLLFAGLRLVFIAKPAEVEPKVVPIVPALLIGVVIGLLSGLTGVGGGIFLSPLLLMLRWAPIRRISAIAAVFILVNSIAGLAGQIQKVPLLPPAVILWGFAAVIGGWIGAEYGSRRLATVTIRRLLSVVLMIAAIKMLFA